MRIFKHIRSLLCKNKYPYIKDNTFIIWEPCSKSHAEIVPGYAKYLIELGYNVSVLVTPDRLKEGLFDRFQSDNLLINEMTQRQIKKFFKNSDLSDVVGVLVTTIGKLCKNDKEQAYESFNENADRSKIFFVEHEVDKLADNNKLDKSIITLRKIDYKNMDTTVVNPHYFGSIKNTDKNDITTFITVGELSEKRKSTKLLINAAQELLDKDITNFKIVVVGKGNIQDLPTSLQKVFEIRGRLDFKEMYDEIEKADFILTAFENSDDHLKYTTIKTSGTFQLVYGFNKPIVINSNFAEINSFNDDNSIFYESNHEYADAMKQAIIKSNEQYNTMRENLRETSNCIYNESLNNLKCIISQ